MIVRKYLGLFIVFVLLATPSVCTFARETGDDLTMSAKEVAEVYKMPIEMFGKICSPKLPDFHAYVACNSQMDDFAPVTEIMLGNNKPDLTIENYIIGYENQLKKNGVKIEKSPLVLSEDKRIKIFKSIGSYNQSGLEVFMILYTMRFGKNFVNTTVYTDDRNNFDQIEIEVLEKVYSPANFVSLGMETKQ